MESPLIKYNDVIAILPPMYCGSIDYYATMAQYATIVIDKHLRYDKRKKFTHRYSIADTHGLLQLTIPVIKPSNGSKSTWNDVKISTHGQWWNVHRVALESAYGRTPFFEYYIDRFLPFLQYRDGDCCENLLDAVVNIDSVIRDILGLSNNIIYSCDGLSPYDTIKDYRNHTFVSEAPAQYYQIRQNQLGFIPNLSILDLIFNMGPESPLVLLKHAQRS